MRTMDAIVLAILAAALLVAVPVAAGEGDAEITIDKAETVYISGETVLEEDVRIESGAEVIVLNGARIDVGDHVLTIGQGAEVLPAGSFEISISGGRMVLEGGSPVIFGTIALPRSTEDVTVSFDGTASLDFKPLSGSIALSFQPSGADRCVHVVRGDTEISIADPSLAVRIGLGSVDITVGFSVMTVEEEKRSGGVPINIRTTTITSSDPGDSLDLALYLKAGEHGHAYLRDIRISSVETSTYYPESDVTNRSEWSGFDRLATSLDEGGVLSTSSHIGEVVSERLEGDDLMRRSVFRSIDWSIAVDLPTLFRVIYEDVSGDSKADASGLVDSVEIDVASVEVDDRATGARKRITDVSVVLERDSLSDYSIEAQWKDDRASYKATSSRLVLNSFGLSSAFVMDLDVSVPAVSVDSYPYSGQGFHAEASGLEAAVSDLDLAGLHDIRSRTGTIGIQQLLDNCLRLHVSASSAAYSKDGREIAAEGLDAVLEKDARRMNTLVVGIGGVEGSVALRDGSILEADVGGTTVALSTDGSLGEHIGSLVSVPRITTDSSLSLQMRSDGLSMSLVEAGRQVSVSSRQTSPDASGIVLDLTVRHTVYRDSTLLSCDASAAGCELAFMEHDSERRLYLDAAVADPEVEVRGMDLGRLALIREETGRIGAIDIADCTAGASVSSGAALADYGEAHAEMTGMEFGLESGVRRIATIDSGGIQARMPVKDGALDLRAASASLSVVSSISFAELHEASSAGFAFGSDVSIDFEADLVGAGATYDGGGVGLTVSGGPSSAIGLDLSFDRSERRDTSLLSVALSAPESELSARWSDGDGKDFDITVAGPELGVEDADAAALMSSMDESGASLVARALDSIGRASLKASSVGMGLGGSRLEMESVDMAVDTHGRRTVTAEAGSLKAALRSDSGDIELRSGAVYASMRSDAAFSDLLNLAEGRMSFGSDVMVSLEARVAGLDVSYGGSSGGASPVSISISGGVSSVITAEASLSYYQKDSKALANASLSADGYRVVVDGDVAGSGTNLHAVVEDPGASIERADVNAIVSAYRSGKVDASILDRIGRIGLSAGSVDADYGDFGIALESVSAVAEASKRHTATVDAGSMAVKAKSGGAEVSAESGAVAATVVSDVPFVELIDAVVNGMQLRSPANASIDAKISGLEARLADGSLTAVIGTVSAEELPVLEADLSLTRTERLQKTVLDAGVEARGYLVSFIGDGKDGGAIEGKVEGPVLTIEGADVARILSTAGGGASAAAEVLDSMDRASMLASAVDVRRGGDSVRASDIELRTGSTGRSSASAYAGSLAAVASVDGSTLRVESGVLTASLSSDASFAGLSKLIGDGLSFEEDMAVSLSAEAKGLEASLDGGSPALVLTGEDDSSVSFEATLSHSERHSMTLLDLGLLAVGYELTADIEGKDGEGIHAVVADPELDVSDADVDALASIFNSTGGIGAADVLDNVRRIDLAARSADVEYGAYGFEAEGLSIGFSSAGRHLASLEAESLRAVVPAESGSTEVVTGRVGASLVSSAGFVELQRLAESGFELGSDIELSLDARAEGLSFGFEKDGLTAEVRPVGGQDDGSMTVAASIRHSERWDTTLLGASLHAHGYDVAVSGSIDGKALEASASDPEFVIEGVDLAALSAMKEAKGELEPADILDSAGRITARALSVQAEYDGLRLVSASLEASSSVSDRYYASVTAGRTIAGGTLDGLTFDMEADGASASVVSDIPFSELLGLVGGSLDLESDAEIGAEAAFKGLDLDLSSGSVAVSASCQPSQGGERTSLVADATLRHSERRSETFLSADISAPGYVITYSGADKDGRPVSACLAGPDLDLDEADVGRMLAIRDRTGAISPTEALDSIGAIALTADSAEVGLDGLEASAESLDIRAGTIGTHSLSADLGAAVVRFASDGRTLGVRTGPVSASLVSSASFGEIERVFRNGLDFESDADISAGAKIEGLEVEFSGESAAASVSFDRSAGSPVPSASLTALVTHSEDSGKTLLNLSLDADGHSAAARIAVADAGDIDLSVDGPRVSVTGADLPALMDAYRDKGGADIGMLDICASIGVAAKRLEVAVDGGEALKAEADALVLKTGTGQKNTVHFEFDSLTANAPVDGGIVAVESGRAAGDAESTVPFAGMADAISGLEFPSDAAIGLEASLAGLYVRYSGDSVSLDFGKAVGSSESAVDVAASLTHSEESKSTLLDADVRTAGCALVFDSRGLHYGKVPVKGDALHMESADPSLSFEGLEIADLVDIYRESGGVKIQQALDRCGSFRLSCATAEVEWDGDGSPDAAVRDASASLLRNSAGQAMVSLKVGAAKVAVPIDGMVVDLDADATEMSLSSDVPFSELVDLVLDGFEFTEDTNMGISLSSKRLSLGLENDGKRYSASFVLRDGSVDGPFRMDLSLAYTLYGDRSALGGRLDCSGYTAEFEMTADDGASGKILSIPFSADADGSLKVVSEDLAIDLSGFDIKSVYDIIDQSGTITVQQLLDSTSSLGVSSASVSVDADSDGAYDAVLSEVAASLSKSDTRQNILSLGFEGLRTSAEVKDGVVTVVSGSSEVVIITEGSLTECIDAIFYGAKFTSETRAEIHLSNEGISVEYRDGDDWLAIANERLSATSPRYVTAVLSMEYSEYRNVTSLVGKLSTIGHAILLKDKTVVDDEGGTVLLSFRTDEASGGFEVDYGEETGFSANLYMPWSLDFSYYDIEFQIDSSDSVVSLTHGVLDVDGYDHEEDGLLGIIYAIKDNDFHLQTRLLLSSGELDVFGKDRSSVLSSYGDTEIGVKKLTVDLKRGDVLNVILENVDLSITEEDGKVVERSLDRLDVTKDVSGAVPEEGWVEKNALLLAAVFIAASVAMAAVLIRHRMKSSRPPGPEE